MVPVCCGGWHHACDIAVGVQKVVIVNQRLDFVSESGAAAELV